jgi:hypothetical protein
VVNSSWSTTFLVCTTRSFACCSTAAATPPEACAPAGAVLAGAEDSLSCTHAAAAAAAATAAAAAAAALSAQRTAAAAGPNAAAAAAQPAVQDHSSFGGCIGCWSGLELQRDCIHCQLAVPRDQAPHHGRYCTADVMSTPRDTGAAFTCCMETSRGWRCRLGSADCCAGFSAVLLTYCPAPQHHNDSAAAGGGQRSRSCCVGPVAACGCV